MRDEIRTHMASSLNKNFIVWQKAMLLVEKVYMVVQKLPAYEERNLVSQMRRASVSIPSNIAEGQYCFSLAQKKHFQKIAYGSCAELETQLEIVERLGYVTKFDLAESNDLVEQIMRILNTLLRKV